MVVIVFYVFDCALASGDGAGLVNILIHVYTFLLPLFAGGNVVTWSLCLFCVIEQLMQSEQSTSPSTSSGHIFHIYPPSHLGWTPTLEPWKPHCVLPHLRGA